MFDTQYIFYAVGLSRASVAAETRNAVECPDPAGGCDRGLIPAGDFHGGSGGFETQASNGQIELSLAAARDFDSESDAKLWLGTTAGQNYTAVFDHVILIRSTR